MDHDENLHEYSFSEDGEIDDHEEYCSDGEPPEPAEESNLPTRLNTTGTIGRAAIKVHAQPSLIFLHFSKTVQNLFNLCTWLEIVTDNQIISKELVYTYWNELHSTKVLIMNSCQYILT